MASPNPHASAGDGGITPTPTNSSVEPLSTTAGDDDALPALQGCVEKVPASRKAVMFVAVLIQTPSSQQVAGETGKEHISASISATLVCLRSCDRTPQLLQDARGHAATGVCS